MSGLVSESIERLGKQHRFLLRVHQAELAQDPTSNATASSRSNIMAVRHTMEQIYGEAVARGLSNLAKQTAPSLGGKPCPTTSLHFDVRDN